MSDSLQGYGLALDFDTSLVCAYASPGVNVEAVTAAPGWVKVGAFYVPKTVQCRLDVLALVSAAGLTATCKLYDMTVDDFVSGSDASFTSQSDGRFLSGVISLTGGRQYLILCQCIGTPSITSFATINTVGLTGP